MPGLSHIRRHCLVLAVLLASCLSGRAATIFVNAASSAGSPDGASWATAYPSLQTALSVATYGDEIWVAKGTYKPGSTNRYDTFLIDEQICLYGGFAGTETAIEQRRIWENPTILSGDINAEGVAADNSYHVMVIGYSGGNIRSETVEAGEADAQAEVEGNYSYIVDGFLIEEGYADQSCGAISSLGEPVGYSSCTEYLGGGLYVSGSVSGVLVSNCTFRRNFAYEGAGMYTSGYGTELYNCVFWNNTASTYGGGLCVGASSYSSIYNCSFNSNSAYDGGAVAVGTSSNAYLYNCIAYGDSGQCHLLLQQHREPRDQPVQRSVQSVQQHG